MRPSIRIALLLFVSSCGPKVNRPVPVIPPPGDQRIIPGVRAGVIEIGMTEAQLLQYGGVPQSSVPAASDPDSNSVYR